jgi:hypothetical protein
MSGGGVPLRVSHGFDDVCPAVWHRELFFEAAGAGLAVTASAATVVRMVSTRNMVNLPTFITAEDTGGKRAFPRAVWAARRRSNAMALTESLGSRAVRDDPLR